MENLFYSEKEKLAFWIKGYGHDIGNAISLANEIMDGANEFAKRINIDVKEVKCRLSITSSSRYKFMRVFYVPTSIPPKGAFSISGDWNMDKWIKY
jgi:hypothetical protein